MKPFSLTLAEIRGGESQEDLTNALAELVRAVSETNKSGEITLKLKLKPGPGGSVEVADEIKMKKPELPKGSSLFFITQDNNLVRNNPNQAVLPGLRDVTDKETGEVRQVAA